MPMINLPVFWHGAPRTNRGWQWLPYTDADMMAPLRAAMWIIENKIRGYGPCEAAFAALPNGRTFTQVWRDPGIWLSYDPDNHGRKYGATIRKEITITRFALRMGRWTTAATLIHELAHTNGAPGGNSHAAEGVLRHCLLGALEDPHILGVIQRVARNAVLV